MGMLYEYSQEEQDCLMGVLVGLRNGAQPTAREIRSALAGAVGLIQLLGSNIDIEPSVRRSMLTNHRLIEAQRVLGLLEQQS